MRRARGFTLIELMIALALAGMVVGGALQLHIAFNRQSQRQQAIAEVQQTLRVSMQILEKAIRGAGLGLPVTHKLPAIVQGSCVASTYYGFQFSNGNAYTDPKNTYFTPGSNDTDPDWFRVVGSDSVGDSGVVLAPGGNGVHVPFNAITPQNWSQGDFFFVIPNSIPPSPGTNPPATANCSWLCANQPYVVTTGYSGTPSQGNPGTVDNLHGAASCGLNPPPGNDPCLTGAGRPNGCAVPGSAMRHISGGGTVYRILDGSDANFPQATPKLVMASAPFGTAPGAMPWVPLADNVEDMQIAVVLADGTVCGASTTGPSDNPANCNFSNAIAVRVTLVGRSSSPQPSVSPSPTGGYEDEQLVPLPPQPDGYIRRSMTTTIILRNFS